MTDLRTIPLQGFVVICPRCLTETDKSDLMAQTLRQVRGADAKVAIVARCIGCELEIPLLLEIGKRKVEAVDVDPYSDVVPATIAPQEFPFVEAARSETEAYEAYQNGLVAFQREDYALAYAFWGAAREWLATRRDARKVNSALLSNMGMALSRLGAPVMALACFEEALGLMDSGEDPDAYATVLNNIGAAHLHLGQMDQAEDFHRRAHESHQKGASDESVAARDLQNLAFTYAKLASRHAASGEIDAAISRARQAVALYKGRKLIPGDLVYFVMLGNLLRRKGDAAIGANQSGEAIDLYREAAAIHEEAGVNPELLVADYDGLARLERTLGCSTGLFLLCNDRMS